MQSQDTTPKESEEHLCSTLTVLIYTKNEMQENKLNCIFLDSVQDTELKTQEDHLNCQWCFHIPFSSLSNEELPCNSLLRRS